MTFSKPTDAELKENQRAMPRRAVIVYVLVGVVIFVCALGVYFGMFIGHRLGA